MNKVFYVLLPLLFLTYSLVFAQQLSFQYDGAGNQVSRKWVCVNCKADEEFLSAARMIDSSTQVVDTSLAERQLQTLSQARHTISAYPNPVNGALQIKWEAHSRVQAKLINVYSIGRQLIYQRNIPDGQQQMQLNFTSLSAGVYLVQVLYSDGTSAVIKVVKQ